jgi:hypothetical protein
MGSLFRSHRWASQSYPTVAGLAEYPQSTPGAIEVGVQAQMGDFLDKELSKVVGLDKVKALLQSLYKKVSVDQKRRKFGFIPEHNLNMLFLGSPGTGKTSMARTVAKMLKHLGVLKKGQLVEVSRRDLVAEYSGQSAIKTMEKMNEAKGGVLFIDEAYTLKHDGSRDSFGQEVLDTLVQGMENMRSELVVIMAGYTKEMNSFLTANSGMQAYRPTARHTHAHSRMAYAHTLARSCAHPHTVYGWRWGCSHASRSRSNSKTTPTTRWPKSSSGWCESAS